MPRICDCRYNHQTDMGRLNKCKNPKRGAKRYDLVNCPYDGRSSMKNCPEAKE